jgi:hypothetical protein
MLPGGGNRLQSRRDVHAVAVDAVILHDHIAKVHADPGLDSLGRRPVGIGDRLCILDRLRTAYRVDHTVELAEHGITRRVDDTPLMRFDDPLVRSWNSRISAVVCSSFRPIMRL